MVFKKKSSSPSKESPADKQAPPKKEEVKEVEKKPEGRIAQKDINLTYRKGSVVPEAQINQWKQNGLKWEGWFE